MKQKSNDGEQITGEREKNNENVTLATRLSADRACPQNDWHPHVCFFAVFHHYHLFMNYDKHSMSLLVLSVSLT